MQRIIHGIASLPDLLKGAGCKRLFLVIDASYPFLSIKDAIESLPVPEKVKFSEFTPNPQYEQVCRGIDLFESSGCDSILAVGGGSAIDVAKCIKLAVLAKKGDQAIIPPLVSQRLPIEGERIPFIAIPTTAGAGQKKSTMMDALCQGIESWWSVNSTDESKEYSRNAVELVMANWEAYIFKNDDEAATQIMLAANYSGRAINLAQTTAAHAMSYKITSIFGLPHGHAVAVCLPEIWDYMLVNPDKCIDIRGKEYLFGIFQSIATAMGAKNVAEAIASFREMMRSLDLGNPRRNLCTEDSFDSLCRSVNPVRLKNNPVGLDSKAISSLYTSILK